MNKGNIAVIGGANIEYIVKSKTDIVQGSKNFVDIEELFGGGGLNYALRLMSTGISVCPLLYIGDDNIGHGIQKTLIFHCEKNSPTHAHVTRDGFFVNGLNTIRSMIIVEGQHRTILAQDQNNENLFLPYLKNEIDSASDATSVLIGHIHNDRMDINENSSDLSTIFAIDYFSRCEKFIYCNFGSTQLEYGFSFWKEKLKSIDVLQLNIDEVRSFFKNDGHTPTLLEIIHALNDLGISAIITLDKFGAIGVMKNKVDTVFLARAVELGDDFVDSTGAGDAFCAGMISVLDGKSDFIPEEFKEAMEVARSWAVYACKSYGGANHCPSAGTIDAFHQKINQGNEVIEYADDRMIDILSLIDSTFS
ncbi:MAG TPA: carbohydrate kinase family protein [Campylobacterales bacterium]|nr:carbohydrate kinase family protein [Campylobacterales bacterium]